MSLEEIKLEILKDYPILKRKMTYHALDLKKKQKKLKLEDGCHQYFDYTSKYKNYWIYTIQIFKKHHSDRAMLISHNDKGHLVISVCRNDSMLFHTGHFFLRYKERCNLELLSFNDIVRAYMKENNHYQFQDIEEIAPDITTFFGEIESGIILGTHHHKLDLIKLNTFLPAEILSPNQQELYDKLKSVSGKYKDGATQVS